MTIHIVLYICLAMTWIGIVGLASKISDLSNKLNELDFSYRKADKEWAKLCSTQCNIFYSSLRDKIDKKKGKKKRHKNPS